MSQAEVYLGMVTAVLSRDTKQMKDFQSPLEHTESTDVKRHQFTEEYVGTELFVKIYNSAPLKGKQE